MLGCALVYLTSKFRDLKVIKEKYKGVIQRDHVRERAECQVKVGGLVSFCISSEVERTGGEVTVFSCRCILQIFKFINFLEKIKLN